MNLKERGFTIGDLIILIIIIISTIFIFNKAKDNDKKTHFFETNKEIPIFDKTT